jgi:hypothetical protein
MVTTTRPHTQALKAKVAELARKMGVSTGDAMDFLSGVSYWMNQGLQYDAAVRKHMQTLREGCDLMLKKAGF